MIRQLLTLLLLSASVPFCFAQESIWFLDAFDDIANQPVYLMSEEIAAEVPDGGHLQGIQAVGNRVFISGSSHSTGYLAIFKGEGVKLGFLGIKILSEKPFTHAGGMQVSNNWLAVGCEDPLGKKKSMVVLQDVTNSRSLAGTPSYALNREGNKNLATAGAVGLLKRDKHFLLAVASWDSRTIDFYTSNHLYPTKSDFEFTYWTTWDSDLADRKEWVDKRFIAYQNIQLFEDGTGIYLVGTGTDTKKRHVADVFELKTDTKKFGMLTKLRNREFRVKGSASFRNGAGLVQDGEKLSLWTVGKHLKPKTFVAVFPAKD